jgi:hypothetical protein
MQTFALFAVYDGRRQAMHCCRGCTQSAISQTGLIATTGTERPRVAAEKECVFRSLAAKLKSGAT